MTDLFDKFIKTGLYLRGWSPKTSLIYKRAFTSYQQSLRNGSVPEAHSTEGAALTKAQLETWVILTSTAGRFPGRRKHLHSRYELVLLVDER